MRDAVLCSGVLTTVVPAGCGPPQPAWRNIGPGGGGWIQSICASPHDPDVAYAGDGIAVTHDGGNTWASLNGPGLTCKQVNVITINPNDPRRLYLGTGGNSVFVGIVPRRRRP